MAKPSRYEQSLQVLPAGVSGGLHRALWRFKQQTRLVEQRKGGLHRVPSHR